MIDKIKQESILKALKRDLESTKRFKESNDSKIEKWKREYNGEPYGNENKDRSQIVSRDIKKQSEWQHATLIEPFVSTPDIIKANPVTFEDVEVAPKIEVLLNTQFCRLFNRYNFMTKALKVLDQEGTVVIRLGWEYEEKMIEDYIEEEVPNPELEQYSLIINQLMQEGREDEANELSTQIAELPQTIKQEKKVFHSVPIKNQPTAMVCKNNDIFIDPTCEDDLDKAQFVIYRYEIDMTTLKQSGIYKNLDKINLNEEDSDVYNRNNEFKFEDNPRKKFMLYEYWGNYDVDGDGIAEPIVCAWIKDTLIRLEDNPFPDKKPPFVITQFNLIPFSIYGESNAELISDIQKIKTAIYRGFIDNMALSNNGQKGIRIGALDSHNKQKFLAGLNFEFNGTPNDFYDGHFNELPGSIFNVLQLMNNEAESITGIASFNTGLNGNALGNTATAVRGVMDSASARRLNIVRNISENLVKPLLRKWLAYDSVFLDEESQLRITNDEFIRLKRDDLGAKIDIDLTISTSDDNQSKASELAFLLQTMASGLDPEVSKILMVEIARLYRMPHLAKELEVFKPTPDPYQQKIQELQIELLQAQVEFERSKALENQSASTLKEAKAGTEEAKAKLLGSQTDKSDLDYLHQYYGTKEKRELDKLNTKNKYDIDKETLKLLEQSKRNYL